MLSSKCLYKSIYNNLENNLYCVYFIHKLVYSDVEWQHSLKPSFDYKVGKQLVKREAENELFSFRMWYRD